MINKGEGHDVPPSALSNSYKGTISMTIYTLYKKVDKLSGLHYLGMTTQDPYKYSGSGLDWRKHLKNNITDVVTTIIHQTPSKKEFNEVGRHYSKLWNITDAVDDFGNKIWANIIPETGSGDMAGRKNPKYNYTVHHFVHIDGREEHCTMFQMRSKYPEISQPRLSTMISKGFGSVRGWRLFGTDTPLPGQTDPNIYNFVHKDGTSIVCTRNQLTERFPHIDSANIGRMICGKAKSAYGWKLFVL